jgi:hypothetical protein
MGASIMTPTNRKNKGSNFQEEVNCDPKKPKRRVHKEKENQV